MLADLSFTTCASRLAPWEIRCAAGPVVATAIHAGHQMRAELLPNLALGPADRLREEDPFTDFWMTLGDSTVRVNQSRFEVDLNRPENLSVYTEPEQSWGLRVWHRTPSRGELEASRALHRGFYQRMRELLDDLVDRWGVALVLDIHSYNHRRRGPDAAADDPADNPDIDLGVTTLDHSRFGGVLERFVDALRLPVDGRAFDVRSNVRYPTGGYFPEWVFSNWGASVCTISLEFKKIFMDEWTSTVDIVMAQRLRTLLAGALVDVREELARC